MRSVSKLLLFVLLTILLTSNTTQSKQQIFLQLVNSNGQPIRGNSVHRGYERQLIVTSFSGITTDNAKVQFTISSGGFSANLITIQSNKETLPYAVFTITESGESKLNILSIIRLEAIRILSVKDTDGSTHVTLQAERIGSTYYQYDRKTGIRSVSGKTGYDYTKRQIWNSF